MSRVEPSRDSTRGDCPDSPQWLRQNSSTSSRNSGSRITRSRTETTRSKSMLGGAVCRVSREVLSTRQRRRGGGGSRMEGVSVREVERSEQKSRVSPTTKTGLGPLLCPRHACASRMLHRRACSSAGRTRAFCTDLHLSRCLRSRAEWAHESGADVEADGKIKQSWPAKGGRKTPPERCYVHKTALQCRDDSLSRHAKQNVSLASWLRFAPSQWAPESRSVPVLRLSSTNVRGL